MFDYLVLQNSAEDPTLVGIIFTVLFSFLLSSLLAFTYEHTSRGISRPANFIQAMVLISIVSAMVMQAIGDSLARGLGMLGALAIIRFRTTLRDPRNMVFMFAAIASGIACGVFGFVIAIVGTVAFCLVAFLLRITPYSKAVNMVGNLRFEFAVDRDGQAAAAQVLRKYCRKTILLRYRLKTIKPAVPPPASGQTGSPETEERIEYEYELLLKRDETVASLRQALKAISGIESIRLNFKHTEIVI